MPYLYKTAIRAVHLDALLPFEKREARAEFEDKRLNLAQNGRLQILLRVSVFEPEKIEDVRIAKHEVGCELVRLLRQRRALEKHPADFLFQHPRAPALDAAHRHTGVLRLGFAIAAVR